MVVSRALPHRVRGATCTWFKSNVRRSNSVRRDARDLDIHGKRKRLQSGICETLRNILGDRVLRRERNVQAGGPGATNDFRKIGP
jgi:hypothetical protein